MSKRKFGAMSGKKAEVALAAPRMDLFFLGTASMMPASTRNVSGTGIRVGSSWWIFDCGEGTQHQSIHKDSLVSTGSITRIFITHLHGDHCFGLPGLLCKMGTDQADRVVEVVGPPGLRALLRHTLSATYTGLTYRYVVHELHWPAHTPGRPGRATGEAAAAESGAHESTHRCEIRGENVQQGPDGTWEVPSRNNDVQGFTVRAAALSHSVPTVGYVVQECSYPGALNPTLIGHRLEDPANVAYLAARGVKQPKSVYGRLKRGEDVELADGVVKPSDVLGPEKEGRKIVVLGDTNDSSRLAELAYGCDVLVHEATNSFIPSLDKGLINQLQLATGVPAPPKGEEYPAPTEAVLALAADAVLAKTVSHGHSTPEMAAQYAVDVAAKTLVLTHFSARYKGDDSEESVAVMAEIVTKAAVIYKAPVHTARDFWALEILPKKVPSPAITPETRSAALQIAADHARGFKDRGRKAKQHPSISAAMNKVDGKKHD